MTCRTSETPIACKQRSIERFGERNVNSVERSEVVPQFPNPRQQEIVRIPSQRKVCEIGERRAAALLVDVAMRGVPPDHLRDLDVQQVRGVQRFARVE